MKWIISNHKMNLTLQEIILYEQELSTIKTNNCLVICPSYPFLGYFKRNNYQLGSQDVSQHFNGSHTGEVSIEQLKSLGVNYTIVGHSERRANNHETNQEISQKIKRLLAYNLKPILCIGEKLEEKENRKQILETQLKEVLSDITDISSILIAYEPVWSIGTGKIPTSQELQETVKDIKTYLEKSYQSLPVLYGGSVNGENIDTLNQISELDGYLIGGTSLHMDQLKIIIERLEEK